MRFSCLGLLHLQLMDTYEVYVFRMYTAGMSTYLVLRILGLERYMFLWWPMQVSLSLRLLYRTEVSLQHTIRV
ncbi:hypothetical protein M6B38_293275 [Iris pallida]|uniref:Uncharacterized protein n=1 Tax=Iris pallida TaxID=29817 RepID=A0AAX6HWE0_IRIPA|nr:hypothetical protein M6B38_293275 [Iris pallida]